MAVVSEFSGSRRESRESSPAMAKSSKNFLRLDEEISLRRLCTTRSGVSCSHMGSLKDSTAAILDKLRNPSEPFAISKNVSPHPLLVSLLKSIPGSDGPNLNCMINWDRSSVKPERIILLPKCWHYRGEGNANLVVALDNEATIVRFSKNFNGSKWSDDQKKKIERQVVYARNIFSPLLGTALVANVRIVYISPDQIAQLNKSLEIIRPGDRLHKEIVMPYATAHSDFARISSFLSTFMEYCIEIKPKKGWWHVNAVKTNGRPNLCTYCLNQFLKMKKSKIASRSTYCPLDLFSGQGARMVKAVTALLMNPQNNMRIFKSGSLAFSDSNLTDFSETLFGLLEEWILLSGFQSQGRNEIGLFTNIVYLICMALITPQTDTSPVNLQRYFQLKSELEKVLQDQKSHKLNNGAAKLKEEMDNQLCYKESCSAESLDLPNGCILSLILQAQKLEDSNDEQIKKVFRKLCPQHKRFKSSLNSSNCPDIKCTSGEIWLDEISVDVLSSEELACIQRHLLAATMKDCSIMLTFCPLPADKQSWPVDLFPGRVIHDLYDGHHCYKVGIVDLDPKPLGSVVKHNLRDAEMVRAYQERK